MDVVDNQLVKPSASSTVSSTANDKAIQAEKSYKALCENTASVVVACLSKDGALTAFEAAVKILAEKLSRNNMQLSMNNLTKVKMPEHSLKEAITLVFSIIEKNTYINVQDLAKLKELYNLQVHMLDSATFLFPSQNIPLNDQKVLQQTSTLFIKDETGNLKKAVSKVGYSSSGNGLNKRAEIQQSVINTFTQNPSEIKQDELGKVLVSFLFIQTLDRFPLDETTKYQNALADYATKYYKLSTNQTISSERLMATYQDLLQSFNESVDISDEGEASVTETYLDFHQNAQGHFGTTCTIFTALSMINELGLYQQIKEKYNLQSYQDVDKFTYQTLRKYNDYIPAQNVRTNNEEIEQINAYRKYQSNIFYGLAMNTQAQVLNDFAEQVGSNYQFTYKSDFDNPTNELGSVLTNINNIPGGIIVGINSSAGAHVVHITQYDSKTKTITYYDSLGRDGAVNVKELSLDSFNTLLMSPLQYIIAEKKQ